MKPHQFKSNASLYNRQMQIFFNAADVHDGYQLSANLTFMDYYSRIARHREYCLRFEVFELVQQWWGRCSVDAFASDATALLPRFWAEASDAAVELVPLGPRRPQKKFHKHSKNA